MIYRLYKTLGSTESDAAMTIDATPQVSFLFDPANTDYQKFKVDVMEGAELQDPDGVPMTPDEAVAYISNLP